MTSGSGFRRCPPIRHYTEGRVRAHIFLCMLAYYVQWHMLEAWRPLLFSDEDQEAKASRDPVAPAKRSEAALKKAHSKKLLDGSEAYSFQSLLQLLSSIVRNVCRVPGAGPDAPTFEIVTTPSAKQQEALDLLTAIAPPVSRIPPGGARSNQQAGKDSAKAPPTGERGSRGE